MENIISAAVNSLADFLNLKKSGVQTTGGELVFSFIYPAADVFSISNELLLHNDPVFIIEKPEEEYKFIAFSKSAEIIENGNQRFSLIDKNIKDYKNKCLNNWGEFPEITIPFFIGAVEFPIGHSDITWKNFNDSVWIVPELILLEYKRKTYIIFNSLTQAAASKNLSAHYKKLLESILLQKKGEPLHSLSSAGIVLKIEGNTPKERKKWKNQINEILEEINSGNIQKVVLSRKIELSFRSPVNFRLVIKNLAERFPACTTFLYRNGDSVFFGASPERLLKFENSYVEFDIMAGSAPRVKLPEEDAAVEKELLSGEKNLNEHKIVLEFIKSTIKPFSEEVSVSETSVKKFSNIQHLWTKVTAKLKPGSSIFRIAKAVYPSPSICGMPKDEALTFIKKIEGYKRGLYSGVIGWMNFDAGELIIAIRSALCQRQKLSVYAGSGIVNASAADEEWEETEMKLNPILSLFSHEN